MFAIKRLVRPTLMLALVTVLGGCQTIQKLASVGQAPQLSAITDPTAQVGYQPVRMPMPDPVATSFASNSLFRSGARGFFKDQRARRIGDILTIEVMISDSAKIANQSERARASAQNNGIGGLLGTLFESIIPNVPDMDITLNTGGTDKGNGSVNRSETLNTQLAAVIVQILPNGNLVIEGRQEVRVNFEVRDLIVTGIVRPEDIGANNTIASSKIAEARISYGGRGQITDVQQPRYGAQVLDAILPF
ncbi:MAG: flagellar basal body L-ring protein FlgH [Alphaproteobacteria bacterium]|nr:flagellar basal body L-ring protein FlgH [Alphaproteobacteria bacterium]